MAVTLARIKLLILLLPFLFSPFILLFLFLSYFFPCFLECGLLGITVFLLLFLDSIVIYTTKNHWAPKTNNFFRGSIELRDAFRMQLFPKENGMQGMLCIPFSWIYAIAPKLLKTVITKKARLEIGGETNRYERRQKNLILYPSLSLFLLI